MIEAKIRMRQQELQDEEERMQKRRDVSSSSSIVGPTEVEYSSTAGTSLESSFNIYDYMYGSIFSSC